MSEHATRLYRNQTRRYASWRGWLTPALALLPLLALLLAGCGTQTGAWRQLTPSGVHIYSLATDPTIPTLIYAGAENGAVYRARADKTGLAVPGAGIPANTVVASLLPDPKIPGRVFAGTTAGLYRSENYGDQWRAFGAGLPSKATLLALASTPDDSLQLAGLDSLGVYRSADDGATWASASSGLPEKATVTALTWDPADQRWWVGLQGSIEHSVYISSDAGQTWAPADGLIRAGADINAFATGQSQPGYAETVFAATSAGVYTNTGATESWRKVASGLPSGAALAATAIAGEPGGVIVAIGSSLYSSTDYGVSWTPVAQGLTNPVLALSLAKDGHGARVYFAASSQLARYPSGVPASNPTPDLLIVAIALALVVGGYLISRRNRRFGYALGAGASETNTGRAAEAARTWERQRGGPSGRPSDAPPSGGTQRETGDRAPSRALAPTDLTARERTGAPADPDKAAQNGHGDPKRRN